MQVYRKPIALVEGFVRNINKFSFIDHPVFHYLLREDSIILLSMNLYVSMTKCWTDMYSPSEGVCLIDIL